MIILIDKFFHIIKDSNYYNVEYQGGILNYIGEGYYLIQFYNFIDGTPSYKQIKNIHEMDNWIFYDTAEEWVEAFKNRKRK